MPTGKWYTVCVCAVWTHSRIDRLSAALLGSSYLRPLAHVRIACTPPAPVCVRACERLSRDERYIFDSGQSSAEACRRRRLRYEYFVRPNSSIARRGRTLKFGAHARCCWVFFDPFAWRALSADRTQSRCCCPIPPNPGTTWPLLSIGFECGCRAPSICCRRPFSGTRFVKGVAINTHRNPDVRSKYSKYCSNFR